MVCDTVRKRDQTLSERMEEVRKSMTAIDRLLAAGRVKPVVGKQGAITFTGIPDDVRNGISDACTYRRIMASGSVAAKLAIQKAEQLAGRTVDRKVVTQGVHSHDGGASWSRH